MKLHTPLARVKGLGSAREGTHHWWAQRLTAIALVPLAIWFMLSLVCISRLEYNETVEWFQSPARSALMILFVFSVFYHAILGMQVILEDYIHCEVIKLTSIILLKFVLVFAGLVGVISVLKIYLGL